MKLSNNYEQALHLGIFTGDRVYNLDEMHFDSCTSPKCCCSTGNMTGLLSSLTTDGR